MKDFFDQPLVTITQEHFEQLQECKALIEVLWQRFGPYDWPKEFRLPSGKLVSDLTQDDLKFHQFTHRMDVLMGFDDSE